VIRLFERGARLFDLGHRLAGAQMRIDRVLDRRLRQHGIALDLEFEQVERLRGRRLRRCLHWRGRRLRRCLRWRGRRRRRWFRWRRRRRCRRVGIDRQRCGHRCGSKHLNHAPGDGGVLDEVFGWHAASIE
jgi:hypothetical protein